MFSKKQKENTFSVWLVVLWKVPCYCYNYYYRYASFHLF